MNLLFSFSRQFQTKYILNRNLCKKNEKMNKSQRNNNTNIIKKKLSSKMTYNIRITLQNYNKIKKNTRLYNIKFSTSLSSN